MKKLFKCFLCLCVSLIFAFAFSSCGGDKSGDKVNLVAIDGNNVGVMSDIDYYVAAEPAASAKVKAISDLNFVGDLQKLYGGENGYPQAVVVAKNSLIGTEILSDFINELSVSYEWLMNEDTSIETVVNSIQSHLTDGLEPSIKAQNLTKKVIENCGIKFISATESKADIVSFMEKLNTVGESFFGMPSDAFFANVTGNAEYSQKISVYAPDGAPAVGLAKLMSENTLNNVEYKIVNANTIQTFVSGASPKADICVLPVNLAVKILGNAQNYKLVGTLTHGNLYLLAKNDAQINGDNIENLKGKTVGVVNLAAVPGLTLKVILKNYKIEYTELYND